MVNECNSFIIDKSSSKSKVLVFFLCVYFILRVSLMMSAEEHIRNSIWEQREVINNLGWNSWNTNDKSWHFGYSRWGGRIYQNLFLKAKILYYNSLKLYVIGAQDSIYDVNINPQTDLYFDT